MDIPILIDDSQPAPAKRSPIEADFIFQLMQSKMIPKVVTPQADTKDTFLPKLSAKNKKTIYPQKTPTYRVDLKKLSVWVSSHT